MLSNTTTVAITYKDGSEQVIALLPLNDPDNLTVTGASTPASAPVSPHDKDIVLPSSGSSSARTAFLYNSLPAQAFDSLGSPLLARSTSVLAPLVSWFTNAGYTVTSNLAAIDGGADLSEVQNAPVLFMQTHGTYYEDEDGSPLTYVLATPNPADVPHITEYQDQIYPQNSLDPTMGFFSYANYTRDPITGIKKYSLEDLIFVTPVYVATQMSFAPNSVVFLNACSLMAQGTDPYAVASQAMVKAFFTAHAGAVLGWDDTVNAVQAADSALYFFDRVLGAGAQGVPGGYPVKNVPGVTAVPGGYIPYAANPANRPYDISTVFLQMRSKPHQASAQAASIYAIVQNPPSISTLNLDETVVVEIDPGPTAGTYVVAPPPGNVPTYATLQLQLNPNGAPDLTGTPGLMPSIEGLNLQNDKQQLIVNGDFGGSYSTRSITIGGKTVAATWTDGSITVSSLPLTAGGNILVTIDGLQSNHVLLNQWNAVPFTLTTTGSSTQIVSCNINLRASFDTLRPGPDQAPASMGLTTDDGVLQNGTCTFASTGDQSGSGPIPWSPVTDAFPESGIGANAFADLPAGDGMGGGSMTITLEAGYVNLPQLNFLDGYYGQLSFDDTTQNLAGGTTPGNGETLEWPPVAGLSPDANRAR
jgi:hypothetical protein